MKIKSINQVSFEISTDTVTIVTDPFAFELFGLKFPKTQTDIAVFSQKKYEGKNNILEGFDKLVAGSRGNIFEINASGEYEIAQMLIQRPINAPYYMFDSGYSRIVYIGLDSKESDISAFEDLGDVEALVVPVGDGEKFVDFDKLQDIISEIEPGILIPYGYKTNDMKIGDGLKTKEEFLHHFGYTNSREEKTLKIAQRSESEESVMDIVFLS